MALTAQQLALRLAKHIGVTSLDPADPSNTSPTMGRGLQPGDVEELTACINAALQEIWDYAPGALRSLRQGAIVHPPAKVKLIVNSGASIIGAFLDYAVWMAQCTIAIEGDRVKNVLLGNNALLRPFRGASGHLNAVVWCDAIAVLPEAVAVIDPVECSAPDGSTTRLRRLGSMEELLALQQSPQAHSGSGRPEACYVESRFEAATGTRKFSLRLHPAPSEPMVLTYGARINVPAIAVSDVAAIPDSNRKFPIPGGWDESVLLPLAVQRLCIHPDFASLTTQTRMEIERNVVSARRIMQGSSPDRAARSLHPVFR